MFLKDLQNKKILLDPNSVEARIFKSSTYKLIFNKNNFKLREEIQQSENSKIYYEFVNAMGKHNLTNELDNIGKNFNNFFKDMY
jgi:hypothetical protein